jgi:hypothetical protein
MLLLLVTALGTLVLVGATDAEAGSEPPLRCGVDAGDAAADPGGRLGQEVQQRRVGYADETDRSTAEDGVRLVPQTALGVPLSPAALLRSKPVAAARLSLVLLLLAFALTFGLTRLYTRCARATGWRSLHAGAVHVHHLVFGIVTVLLSGLSSIGVAPGSPGRELLAIAFGIGAALTLDEFALWLHLRDVYWWPEGRSSIEATMLGALVTGLLLVGTSPFGIGGVGGEPGGLVCALIAVNVTLALVTFLKGKLALGLIAVFVPFVGLVGTLRLAKPGSSWARWLYAGNGRKLARAQARHGDESRLERLRRGIADVLGGAPSFPAPTALEAAV